MKNLKRVWTLILSIVLSMSLCIPAFAATEDTGFSDVAADAWFADAVVWCRDNGIMSGTSPSTFSPDSTMTRAMLATVLYRAAGSPEVSELPSFTDTSADVYYSSAVVWASDNGIVTGYGNNLFGTNDPVTREQIATILWRYDGSKAVQTSASFTDTNAISTYAIPAVNWAVENGIVTGMGDGSFNPTGSATRAQVAVMIYRYLHNDEPQTPETPVEPTDRAKVLVAYLSNTGHTQSIAQQTSEILNAELYVITPENPYTSADLNYNNSSSRATAEQNNPNARPAIAGEPLNMADYDVIFVGYPIWFGQAPRIINTFLESYDLSGKIIVPFCTSASSGIGSSDDNLHISAPAANWQNGQRFSGSETRTSIETWINGLNLLQTATGNAA